jgi:purine-binding chemotaxis protein CheW
VTHSEPARHVDPADEQAAPSEGQTIEDSATLDSATEAIVVRLGAGAFAIDLGSVAEVGRVPVVTRVPGAPDWLAGLANWRGRILAVLDLRAQLGADPVPLGRPARLVVLSSDGVVAGIVVDAVAGTTSLTDVVGWPAGNAATATSLISGQAPRADGPLAVIDAAAVMRLRDTLPRRRRTA